jgi:molecular chaperone HscB
MRTLARHGHAPDIAAAMALHFDTATGALRPFAPGEEPDIFTLFGLPPRLVVNESATRDLYLDLSRRVHPDFHAGATADHRDECLRRTSMLNNAWQILREPARRAEYAVARWGLNITSQRNAAPPELLAEMFEIQEAGESLREARLAADGATLAAAEARVAPLRAEVLASRNQLLDQMGAQMAAFDTAADGAEGNLGAPAVQEALRALRLTLDRLNYVRTVLRNLK